MGNFCTYIMAGKSRVLYIGVTNDLDHRAADHRSGEIAGFSSRYKAKSLVYYGRLGNPRDAIAGEKRLKGWRREKKVRLVESLNPQWSDFATDCGP